jgi:hypothetical protein
MAGVGPLFHTKKIAATDVCCNSGNCYHTFAYSVYFLKHFNHFYIQYFNCIAAHPLASNVLFFIESPPEDSRNMQLVYHPKFNTVSNYIAVVGMYCIVS